MNPARMDMANDIRRFWWTMPTLAIAGILFLAFQYVIPERDNGNKGLANEFTQQYRVSGDVHIDAESFAGNITVEAGASDKVSIRVRKRVTGKTTAEMDAALQAIDVRFGRQENTVRVDVDQDGPAGMSRADITITAPARAQLELDAHRGSITVSGMLGDVQAKTGNGNILVQLPSNSSFTLNGDGNLKSDFRLVEDASGQYTAGTPSPSQPPQELLLHANEGDVVLRRQ